MNRFDQIDQRENLQGLDGWLSKKWKSVKKVGSKLNVVRKKLTPKILRKPLSKMGKGVRTGVSSVMENKVVAGALAVVGTFFPPVAIAAAAMGAIAAYDMLENNKKMTKKAKTAFYKDIDKLFYLHPNDREKIYQQAGIGNDTRQEANAYLSKKYDNLSAAEKLAYNKKVFPKKHAAMVKKKWEGAVKRRLASMPPEQAYALVAKKMYQGKKAEKSLVQKRVINTKTTDVKKGGSLLPVAAAGALVLMG